MAVEQAAQQASLHSSTAVPVAATVKSIASDNPQHRTNVIMSRIESHIPVAFGKLAAMLEGTEGELDENKAEIYEQHKPTMSRTCSSFATPSPVLRKRSSGEAFTPDEPRRLRHARQEQPSNSHWALVRLAARPKELAFQRACQREASRPRPQVTLSKSSYQALPPHLQRAADELMFGRSLQKVPIVDQRLCAARLLHRTPKDALQRKAFSASMSQVARDRCARDAQEPHLYFGEPAICPVHAYARRSSPAPPSPGTFGRVSTGRMPHGMPAHLLLHK